MRFTELYEERATIDGVTITILRNPLPSLLMFFVEGTRRGIARGIMHGEDVIYWDACKATHADMQEYLGMEETLDGFDVAEGSGYFRVTCRPEFEAQVLGHANTKRSITDPAMHFVRENGQEVPLA